MKKLSFILICCFSVLLSSAQDISLIAGANFSNAHDEDGSLKIERAYSFVTGFTLGISTSIHIGDSSGFFETGLLYATKGFDVESKQEVDDLPLKTTATYKLHYIDLPLSIKITGKPGGKSVFYFSFGGYVAMGISGTIDLKAHYDGNTETLIQSVNWDSDDATGLSRIDYGLNAGAGLRTGDVSLGLYYNHGLRNLSPAENDRTAPHLRVISIRIGLYL